MVDVNRVIFKVQLRNVQLEIVGVGPGTATTLIQTFVYLDGPKVGETFTVRTSVVVEE